MRHFALICFVATVVVNLQAAPAQAQAVDDGLDSVRELFNGGKTEDALVKAKEVYAKKFGDPDVSLRALVLMSQCYQEQGVPEKELLCYAQLATPDWFRRVGVKERARIFGRVQVIADQLENEQKLPPVTLVRLTGTVIGIRKPLLLDDLMGKDKADALVSRMCEVRSRACDALKDRAQADADRYTIVSLPVGSRLANRLAAAVALLKEGEANREKVLSLLLVSPDDATAFVCQAALTQYTVDSKEWPVAMAQLKRLYYLCPPDKEHGELLYMCVGALANDIPRDLMVEADAKALAQYAADGPQDRDGDGWANRWTVREFGFAMKVLNGTLPDYEKGMLAKRLKDTEANAGLAQRRLRTRWLLLSEQADAAVKEAYEGYRASPRGVSAQTDMVHDFVTALKVRKGAYVSPEPFLEFAAFGKEGRDRDRKPGASNDIKDPFQAALHSDNRGKP